MNENNNKEMKKILLMGFNNAAILMKETGEKRYKNANFEIYASHTPGTRMNITDYNYDIIALDADSFGGAKNDLEKIKRVFNSVVKQQPTAKILLQSIHDKETLNLQNDNYRHIEAGASILNALADEGLTLNKTA